MAPPWSVPAGIAVISLLLASCGGGENGTGPGDGCQAATVMVDPGSVQLFVGNSRSFTATILNSSGGSVNCELTWVSSATSVATVDGDNGFVEAVGQGQATVTARTERGVNGIVSGSAQVTVPQPDGTAQPGGTVIQDGQARVSVDVPAGAVSTATAITIIPALGASLPGDPPGASLVPNTAFEFGPIGLQFASSATLSIGYNRAALPAGSSENGLRIYRAQGGSWVAVGGSTVDTGNEEVSAPVSGFSIYAVGAPDNAAPTATISQPADGTAVETGQQVTFTGSATDPEDGQLTGNALVWTSSIDDQIGTGETFTTNALSVGQHMITLTATDDDGATGVDTRTLTVEEVQGSPAVRIGDTPSSDVVVGGQLILPIHLDLSQTPNLEVADLELLIGFSNLLFGSESWTLNGADFTLIDGDTGVDGSVRLVQGQFTRNGSYTSSVPVGVLTLDAAAVGTASVEVAVVTAAEPDGTPIGAGLFAEFHHQVDIGFQPPPTQTLQPGGAVTDLEGGVHYFRVPVGGGGPLAVGPPAGPDIQVVPGAEGGIHGHFGRSGADLSDPFGADAPVGPELAHVQVLRDVLSDATDGAPAHGPTGAALAAGQTLRIQISGGTPDADLYVRHGEVPTPNLYDCRPFATGNDERCDAIDPPDGDWYVMVRPFGTGYAGVTLEAFLFDAVSIVTASLPDGFQGVPYDATLEAADGDGTYEWSHVGGSLPPDLQLDPDGTLSGTPGSTGDFTFTVRVTSAGKAAEMQYTVSIAAGAVPMAYVFVRHPTQSSYLPDPVDHRNLSGETIQITRTGVGRHTIVFNGMGSGTLGSAFTATVTTVATADNTTLAQGGPACTLNDLNAGSPVTAFVACDDPATGSPVDGRFRLMVVGDEVLGGAAAPGQEGAFSLHNQLGAGSSYTPNTFFSWNSDGAAQSVQPQVSDVWRHIMGTTMSTPYVALTTTVGGGGGNACALKNGTGTYLDVQCFSRTGGTMDVRHLAFQFQKGRPQAPWGYGYVIHGSGLSATYTSASAGNVSASSQGTGRWRVSFDGIDLTSTPAIAVSPVLTGGATWTYCSQFLVSGMPLTVDVACYNAAGTFTDQGFFIAVLR